MENLPAGGVNQACTSKEVQTANNTITSSSEDVIKHLSHLLNISLKPPSEKAKRGLSIHEHCEKIYSYSSQASIINRSLAFGGIAIVWLFKKDEHGSILPDVLNTPLFLLGISLALDLCQYFYGAIAYRIFYGRKFEQWINKKLTDEQIKDIEVPGVISYPIDWLFYLKIAAMIVAYFFIIKFLFTKL